MSSKKKTKKTVARYARTVQKNLRNSLRECVNGCGRAKATHRYCADCGTALPGTASAVPTLAKSAPVPISAPAFVAKSEAPTDALRFRHNDPDPAAREAAWHAQFDYLTKGR